MSLQRFFGGPPIWVLVRLVLLSLVIGVILSVLGLHPLDLFDGLARLARRLWLLGFDAFEDIASYLVLGAMIVIPIWIVIRLFNMAGGRGGD